LDEHLEMIMERKNVDMGKDAEIAMKELGDHRQIRTRKKPRIANEKSPFMCKEQVLELIPIGKSMMYLMIKNGEFPKPKQLGERAVAWSRAEIDAWIADKLK
jgi:prophage regulatory protein